MRSTVVLALMAVCLLLAAPARAGWTVDAKGECVPAWIASPASQGPVAMLNAFPLPVRQAVGGGQVAASGSQGKGGGAALKVLSWPALVLGGFGVGLIESPIWLITGLVDTLSFGSLDLVPNDAKALTLTSVRPRFLGPTGTTPESCAAKPH